MVLIALSVPLIVVIVLYTIRRARELDARIQEYHAEQDAASNQPGAANPYDQMAELFGNQAPDSRPITPDPRSGSSQ